MYKNTSLRIYYHFYCCFGSILSFNLGWLNLYHDNLLTAEETLEETNKKFKQMKSKLLEIMNENQVLIKNTSKIEKWFNKHQSKR